MANFRIIYDNRADGASLAVSSQASAGLGAANLLTDIKSEVWRASTTSGTITATWAVAQLVSGVALPFTNLTADATIRVRGYTETADTTPAFDTGAVPACPPLALGLWGWGTTPMGVNAFAYAGSAYANIWFAAAAVKKLVIDLVDASNSAGYIEVGRLVTGTYWEGLKGADYGASMTLVDTSKHLRSDAGDLLTDVGTKHRKQSVPLTQLPASERLQVWNILVGNGMARPVFLSVFPGDADNGLEQCSMIYGKLVEAPGIAIPAFRQYATTLEIEEV